MSLISKGNSKLKKSGIVSFGIPAIKTCPQAGQCKLGCYATMGTYVFPVVKAKRESNFEATKRDDFAQTISEELNKMRRVKTVRIHDSGDFYNKQYFFKWIAIATWNPQLEFYAYTKMVRMVKNYADKIPSNLKIIFSYGGKQDFLIDRSKDRHSMVFRNETDLLNAGYIDASHDDTLATTPNKKVGLVYHGTKGKIWDTKKELTNKKNKVA